MKPKVGPLLLSDFGEARLGPGPHIGDIMPIMYRAPETILYVPWSYPVDIWSVGLTVGLGLPPLLCIKTLTDDRHGIFCKGEPSSQHAKKTAVFLTVCIFRSLSRLWGRHPPIFLPKIARGRSNTGMRTEHGVNSSLSQRNEPWMRPSQNCRITPGSFSSCGEPLLGTRASAPPPGTFCTMRGSLIRLKNLFCKLIYLTSH